MEHAPLIIRTPSVTWHDVARVREDHPDWSCGKIARALGCHSAYVRATFQRRKWANPGTRPVKVKVTPPQAQHSVIPPIAPIAWIPPIPAMAPLDPIPPMRPMEPIYPMRASLFERDDKQSRRTARSRNYLRTGALD